MSSQVTGQGAAGVKAPAIEKNLGERKMKKEHNPSYEKKKPEGLAAVRPQPGGRPPAPKYAYPVSGLLKPITRPD